jgi:hypothetical protein
LGAAGFAPKLCAEAPASTPLTYVSFIDLVTVKHPEGVIDEKRVAKAKVAVARAGILPDPRLSVGREVVPLPGRLQEGPVMDEAKDGAEWSVNLSQSFP